MFQSFLDNQDLTDEHKHNHFFQSLTENQSDASIETQKIQIEYALITQKNLPILNAYQTSLLEKLLPWYKVILHAFSSTNNLHISLKILTFRFISFLNNLIYEKKIYAHENYLSTIAQNLKNNHYSDDFHIHKIIKETILKLMNTPIDLVYTKSPHPLEETYAFFPSQHSQVDIKRGPKQPDVEKIKINIHRAMIDILHEIQTEPINYLKKEGEGEVKLYQEHNKIFLSKLILCDKYDLIIYPECCSRKNFIENIVTQIQENNIHSVTSYINDIYQHIVVMHRTKTHLQSFTQLNNHVLGYCKINKNDMPWCANHTPCYSTSQFISLCHTIYAKESGLSSEDINKLTDIISNYYHDDIMISVIMNIAMNDKNTLDVLENFILQLLNKLSNDKNKLFISPNDNHANITNFFIKKLLRKDENISLKSISKAYKALCGKNQDFMKELFNSIHALITEITDPTSHLQDRNDIIQRVNKIEKNMRDIVSSEYLDENGKIREIKKLNTHLQNLLDQTYKNDSPVINSRPNKNATKMDSITDLIKDIIEPKIRCITKTYTDFRESKISQKKDKITALNTKINCFLELISTPLGKQYLIENIPNVQLKSLDILLTHAPWNQGYHITDLYLYQRNRNNNSDDFQSLTSDSTTFFKLMCLFSILRSKKAFHDNFVLCLGTIKDILSLPTKRLKQTLWSNLLVQDKDFFRPETPGRQTTEPTDGESSNHQLNKSSAT